MDPIAAGVLIGVVVTAPRWIRLLTSSDGSRRPRVDESSATKISAVAEGTRVCVVGAVMQLPGSEEFVTGPCSGERALAIVYERYEIERTRYERRRILRDRIVRHVPFALEDDSGVIGIDLAHATLSLKMVEVEVAKQGPNRVFGADIIAANQDGQTENMEGGVVPGNRLSITGRVTRSPSGVLVLSGTQAEPLTVVALG